MALSLFPEMSPSMNLVFPWQKKMLKNTAIWHLSLLSPIFLFYWTLTSHSSLNLAIANVNLNKHNSNLKVQQQTLTSHSNLNLEYMNQLVIARMNMSSLLANFVQPRLSTLGVLIEVVVSLAGSWIIIVTPLSQREPLPTFCPRLCHIVTSPHLISSFPWQILLLKSPVPISRQYATNVGGRQWKPR